MKYFYLIIASLFEIGWPLGFKLANEQPAHFLRNIVFAAICMALSGVFLYLAQREMPISTAYIVWTGMGAIGTFLIGIFIFNDPSSALRMVFAGLILAGIVGLELTS